MSYLFKTLLNENQEIIEHTDPKITDNFDNHNIPNLSDIQKENYETKVRSNELEELKDEEFIDFDVSNLDIENKLDECVSEIKSTINLVSYKLNTMENNFREQYFKVLTESIDIDADMESLNESAEDSKWSTLIDLISKLIRWIKDKFTNFAFNLMSKMDYYGTWVSKNEALIKKAKKFVDKSNTTYIDMDCHKWNTNKLFQCTEFNDLYKHTSTILGVTNDKDLMKNKVEDYEARNWTAKSMYKYIMAKCLNVDAKELKGDMSDINEKAIKLITGGDKLKVKVTSKLIDDFQIGLKLIKTEVAHITANAKNKIVNKEIDLLLDECKREAAKREDNKDGIKYRYYRHRYDVYACAQQVALNLYSMKIKLLNMYANEAKGCLTTIINEYLSTKESKNESIDYMAMNNTIIDNPEILNESTEYVDTKYGRSIKLTASNGDILGYYHTLAERDELINEYENDLKEKNKENDNK